MSVAYHPAVQRDVCQILRHYDSITEKLGNDFWTELKSFIRKAAADA
jgi:hypothetical protein